MISVIFIKNISTPTQSETQLHEAHIKNKEVARKKKSTDKELAKVSDGKILVATFDFQKVLTAPYDSILYYKRKLFFCLTEIVYLDYFLLRNTICFRIIEVMFYFNFPR